MSGYERLLGGYSATQKAIADATDPTSLFRDATWSQVGQNKELTEFLQRSIDPDGSKYGGDIDALKTELLNTTTMRGSSALASIFDAAAARTEGVQKKRFENLVGRLYEDAPNRLFSGNSNDTLQALKAGALGMAIDLPLELIIAPASLARLGWNVGKPALQAAGKSILAREGTQQAIERAAAGQLGSGELLTDAAKAAVAEAKSAGMWTGAKGEFISGAASGFLGDVAQQDAAVQRKLQDEISLTGTALNTVGGGALGAAIGGAVGRFADGRQLGRELTEGLPGSPAKLLPDRDAIMGGDSIVSRVEKERASIGPRTPEGFDPRIGAPDATPGNLVSAPEAYTEYNTKLKDLAGDLDEFARGVATGAEKSAYTPDQIGAMRGALDRLVNPTEMAAAERRSADSLRLRGDPASVQEANVAELRAMSYERFSDYITQNEFGLGDFFSSGGDIRPEVKNALVQFDPQVAAAFTPQAAPAARAAAPAPAAGGAAPAAAPAQAAAPAAPGAEAAPVEPTPTQAAGDAPAAPAPGAPTAKDVESLAEAGFTPEEKTALADLQGMLVKANMDLDGVMNAMSQVGQQQVIADLAKTAGADRGAVKSALTKVTAATVRERAKAAPAATPVASSPVAPPAAPAVAPAASAPAPVASSPAAPAQAATQVEQQVAEFSGLTHRNLVTTLGATEKRVGEVLDGILTKMEDGGASGDKAAIARQAISDNIAALPELESVLGSLDPEKLTSAKGIARAKLRVAQMTKDAVAFTYAKALGDILPDPMNATDFDVLLRALPGIPAEDAAAITHSYREMVGNALAERAAAVGMDRVRREFGPAWESYVAGTGGFQSYGGKSKVKVEFEAIVKAGAHGLDTNDAVKMGAILRDFRKQLEASGVPMDSQFVSEALYIRAAQARDDLAKGVFEAQNKGDFDKIAAMRKLRNVNDEPTRDGYGSMVGNPIVDRLIGDGRPALVSGRTQPRNMDGTTGLGKPQSAFSDGISDYLGLLWANPRRAFTAAGAARRAIYGAAVENASWAKATMRVNGKKVSGAQKELKGLQAETIHQVMEQQRFLNLVDARKNRIEMGADAYRARVEQIGTISGRKVGPDEEAVVQRWMDSEERITSAMSIHRREVAEILRSSKEMGESPTAQVATLLGKVNTTIAKHQGDMVRAMTDFQTKAQAAAGGKELKGKRGGAAEGAEKGEAAKEAAKARTVPDANDADPLKVRFKGADYEVVPGDVVRVVADEDGLGGSIEMFGKAVGRWAYQKESQEAFDITTNAGRQFFGFRSFSDVLKRSALVKDQASLFDANLRKLVKAGDSSADVPEGASIPKEVSRTAEVRAAQSELMGEGKVVENDLDKTLASFEVPEGRVLAFKRKDDSRVLKAGLSGDASLRAALAKMRTAADGVEIGTIPAGRVGKSGAVGQSGQDWALANFVPMGRDTGTPDAAVVRKIAADGESAPALLKAKRQAISLKDAAKIALPDGRSLAEVVMAFDKETVELNWSSISDATKLGEKVATLQRTAEIIESVAPHGIKRENASRRTAFSKLEQHMTAFTAEERGAALDLLRRMDMPQGQLPYFYGGELNAFARGKDQDVGKSAIFLNTQRRSGGVPAHTAVIHEVAHWAYHNMLTPSEKVQFLQSLAKHYDENGALNMGRVLGSMTHAENVERAVQRPLSGLRKDVNEVFAWQFTDWVMQRTVGKEGFEAEASLWQRVLEYGRSLIQYFVNSKVDPDLVPIFERILPTRISDTKFRYDALYDKSLGTLRNMADVGEEARKSAGSVVDTMEKVDVLRSRLAQHLFTPGGLGDVGLAEDLKTAANHMFGLLYGREANKTVTGLRAKLNPVRDTGDWLRDASGKVVKDKDGKGVRAPQTLEGAVDPRELFSRSETGKLMQAVRDMAPEGMDDAARNNVAFQAAVDAEEFEMVLKASSIGDNPEVATLYRQTVEMEYERLVKDGVAPEKALDDADLLGLKEAAAYAKEEFGIDIGANIFDGQGAKVRLGTEEQRQALGSVARKLYDLMGDGLDHLQVEVERFGFSLRRADNGIVQEVKTPVEVALEKDVEKKVAAATRRAKKSRKQEAAPATEKSAAVVAREEAERAVDGKADGVPTGASPLVKSLIARVPHRDPEQQDIIGTLMYRLFSHVMGPDNIESVTNGDIARMMGVALEDGYKADAMANQGTAAFDAMRKAMRLASEDLTNGNKSPMSAVDFVIDVLARHKVADLAEEFEVDLTADSLAKMVKDVARGKEPKATEIAGALYETLGEVTDILSGLGKTTAAKSEIGDAVAATPGRPVSMTFSDGSYHPMFAKADLTAKLSSLPVKAAEKLLRAIGVDAGDDAAGALSRNIAYVPAASSERKTLLVTLDDVRAMGANGANKDVVRAVEKIDDALSVARSRGDHGAAATLMAQREAAFADSTASDAVLPVLVNMDRVFDPVAVTQAHAAAIINGAVKAGVQITDASDATVAVQQVAQALGPKSKAFNDILKGVGFIGSTDGTSVKLFDKRSGKLLDKEMEKLGDMAKADAQLPDTPLVGEIVLHMALEGENVRPDPLAIEQRSLVAGATEPVAKLMGKLFKKNRNPAGLDAGETQAVKSFHGIQLAENSVRIARAGGKWLADNIKPVEGTGFFESLYTKMAGDLIPMVEKIDKLTGKDGVLSKTVAEIYRNGAIWRKGIPQSELEERVVNAMRQGDISRLSREEQRIATEMQAHFRKLREMQNDAGIPVGDVTSTANPFYLPQRFNLEWINSNKDEAVKLLAKWMAKDSGDTIESATQRANKVVLEAINREELKGIIDGASNVYTQAFGDKLHSRSLNITGKDWEAMAPMFDNNLKSLLISYTEAAHKRTEWTNRFGVKGHGANTYTDIASRGGVAALEALMGSASEMALVRSGRSNVNLDEAMNVQFSSNLFSPLTKNESEAEEIVMRVSGVLDRDGKDPATRAGLVAYLESLYSARGGQGAQHFSKRAEAIVNGLADFGIDGRGVANKEIDFMLAMVGTMEGRPAYTINANQGLRTAAGYAKTFNSITLLSTAVLSSIGDLSMSLIRSGSAQAWLAGTAKAAKAALSDPATAAAMRRIGVGIESILNENITNVHGGTAGRVANAFFWANGLTQWTNAMRQTSAMVGFESIKANQAIVKRERASGNFDSWSYRKSMRYLRQLGLGHLADEEPLGHFAAAVGDTKLAEAIHRFTNESVFQPNRNDMPLWTQDPIAGLLWQFKSYPTMMGRLVKRQIGEAFATENGKYAGDPSGLMYLLTIGAAMGAGSMAVKDVVLGKNQEADKENPGSDWRSLRDRSFTKIADGLGFKEQELVQGEKDALIGWYAEGLMQLGALGFLGDLMYSSAKSLDNGAFGRERVMSQMFGPTYGTFIDMSSVIAGGLEGIKAEEGDPNGKQREAARKVLKRIPGVGGQDPIIEGWVNDMAGEATAPGAGT